MPKFVGFEGNGWPKYEDTLDDVLLPKINEEERGIAEYESFLAKFPNEPKLQEVVKAIIEEEKKHVSMLKELFATTQEKKE